MQAEQAFNVGGVQFDEMSGFVADAIRQDEAVSLCGQSAAKLDSRTFKKELG
jgi:hypothetical protein